MSNKKVLLVFGMTYNQIPLIQAGKEMNYYVIAIGKGGGVCENYADEWFSIDTSDIETVLKLAKEKNVSAMVTCGTSTPICTICYVNEQLGLSDKMISYEISLNAAYKDRFRNIIPHLLPYGVETDDCSFAFQKLKSINPPYILKPADGGGGKGITVVYSTEEEEFIKAFEYAHDFSQNGKVIAEQFIEGSIIGAESFTVSGKTSLLTIADKIISPGQRCVTLGLTMPSILNEEIQKAIKEVNREAISLLGIKWGPTHIDMAIDKKGKPYIIDIGPRLAGGPIMAELIPKMYNYDFYKATILLSAGLEPQQIPENESRIYFSERFITTNSSGVLKEITIPDKDVLDEFNVLSYRKLKQEGVKLQGINNDGDRVFMYTAWGDDYEKLNKRQDEFEKLMHFRIEKE